MYVLPKDLEKNIDLITSSVHVMYAGVAAGIQKGGDFLPEHALALSTIVNKDVPHIELTEEESLKFLKKESIRSHELPKGIYAVRYKGLNLGWVKAVPGRLNNLLPMEFRIRKNIEW
jgi:NOL1/NOP2/fmu family ribosome biogenesis protein